MIKRYLKFGIPVVLGLVLVFGNLTAQPGHERYEELIVTDNDIIIQTYGSGDYTGIKVQELGVSNYFIRMTWNVTQNEGWLIANNGALWLGSASGVITNNDFLVKEKTLYISSTAESGADSITIYDDGTDAFINPENPLTIGNDTEIIGNATAYNYIGATATLSSDNDDYDVTDIATLWINTDDNTVTLGGLQGGVNGQELNIVMVMDDNNFVLEDAEGVGTQDIHTPGSDDITFEKEGGAVLVCNGTVWKVVSYSKE